MIETVDIAYLSFLWIGVLIGAGIVLAYVIFPKFFQGSKIRFRILLVISTFATFMAIISALIYSQTSSGSLNIVFDCAFEGSFAPTVLTCTDATEGGEHTSHWQLTEAINKTQTKDGRVAEFVIATPGNFKVALTAEQRSLFSRGSNVAERTFSIAAPPPPRSAIQSFPFQVQGFEPGLFPRTFSVAPGEKIVGVQLEIQSAERAEAQITNQTDSRVDIVVRLLGNLDKTPFGFNKIPSFIAGTVIITVQKRADQ